MHEVLEALNCEMGPWISVRHCEREIEGMIGHTGSRMLKPEILMKLDKKLGVGEGHAVEDIA